MKFNESINILYVEDDDCDVEAMKRAWVKADIKNPLHIANDGVEALEAMSETGGIVPEPRILLLDINMPRMNGLELLAKLREDERLCDTVVFIMTTSSQESDLLEAYNLKISGYIQKPTSSRGLVEAMAALKKVWEQSLFLGQDSDKNVA